MALRLKTPIFKGLVRRLEGFRVLTQMVQERRFWRSGVQAFGVGGSELRGLGLVVPPNKMMRNISARALRLVKKRGCH